MGDNANEIELNTYFMMCVSFAGMSQNFYLQYSDACEKHESILNGRMWDILKITTEEHNVLTYWDQMRFHCAIVAVIFQALAVEAFVNAYCYEYCGGETFNSYDKKERPSIFQKVRNKIFRRFNCETDFDKSENL